MHSSDNHWWVNGQDILPSGVRRHRLQSTNTHGGGMVLGVHLRRRASVSAAQFELRRRNLTRRGNHRRRLLHHHMAGVGDPRKTSKCVV